MKQFFHSLLLCFTGVLICYLQSCRDFGTVKCSDTEIINQNISASDLSKVPYSGFDTLYFLSKTGDTCIVRGTGKKFGFETEYSTGDPACPPEKKYINQIYSIDFVSSRGDLDFTLLQKRSPPRVYINKSSYPVVFNEISSLIDLKDNDSNYFLDSAVVYSKVYYNVSVFLSGIKNEIQQYDKSYRLLYNKQYGVIQIKSTKDNQEYDRIQSP